MRQKGFATIFGLCLILVFALIVKGIQEAETNHAREVLNFQMEQALQSAAESGILEAAEYVRQNPGYLPYIPDKVCNIKEKISVNNKTFHQGDKKIDITVEAWGERGEIYFYKKRKVGNIIKDVEIKKPHVGVYFMSCAKINSGILGEDIYRRAYGYVLSEDQNGTYIDDTTIYFMELPTQYGYYVTKK